MSADAKSESRRIWTPSNVITMTRILLVPVFVAALLAPWPEWFGMSSSFFTEWKSVVAAGIFVLISCTDWLDGYLARSRNEITDFGKFMDPLADKILVAAALIALVELGDLPTWVVLVILAREFIVSGVRMLAASKGVVVAASMLGKFKTVFQMIAIVLFTIKDSHMIGDFGEAVSDGFWDFCWVVMIIALVLTVASMVDYLYKARELLGFDSTNKKSEEAGVTEPLKASENEGASQEAGAPALHDLEALAESVVKRAGELQVSMATAESLTGGMIGTCLTAVPGSSCVYKGGVISYVNEVKRDVLHVDESVLSREGAVCEEVAIEMARNARESLDADVAVSVTGIAGPGGAEPGKPVGTVWMGVARADGAQATRYEFGGDRDEVRRRTVETAFHTFLDAFEH